MKAEHRYAVAFIAASIGRGKVFTHVHDHDAAADIPMGGIARADKVDVFDGRTRARIAGKPPGLYHYGSEEHIELKVEDNALSGFDYLSRQHFAGRLVGDAVQIYDHGTGRYHNFHVS